jgi:cytochrome b
MNTQDRQSSSEEAQVAAREERRLIKIHACIIPACLLIAGFANSEFGMSWWVWLGYTVAGYEAIVVLYLIWNLHKNPIT